MRARSKALDQPHPDDRTLRAKSYLFGQAAGSAKGNHEIQLLTASILHKSRMARCCFTARDTL
eukprot:scaffold428945_cov38-Prasinocladus_malaysianus.AAC.1